MVSLEWLHKECGFLFCSNGELTVLELKNDVIKVYLRKSGTWSTAARLGDGGEAGNI